MAADLHIHVTHKIDEEAMQCFFSSTIGSKYYIDGWDDVRHCEEYRKNFDCKHNRIISDSRNIHVGEVSWLKAALFQDSDEFVPETVGQVADLIGDGVEITEDLVENIDKAFELPNKSIYDIDLERKRKQVVSFMRDYIGYHAFTVSW